MDRPSHSVTYFSIQVQSERVFPKVLMQKGIAIADYMLTLGHCQDTGRNLQILEGRCKTFREQDENHFP